MILESHRIAIGLLGLSVFIALAMGSKWVQARFSQWAALALLATMIIYLLAIVVRDGAARSTGEALLQIGISGLVCCVFVYSVWDVWRRPSLPAAKALRRWKDGYLLIVLGVAGVAVLYSAAISLFYGAQGYAAFMIVLAMVIVFWDATALRAWRGLEWRHWARTLGLLMITVASAYAYIYFGVHTRWHALVKGTGSNAEVNLANDWGVVLFHDQFHYFLGAKYFPEVGYNKLYDCAAVAQIENGYADLIATTRVRDLESNLLLRGERFLDDPPTCQIWFGETRWQEFRQDVLYFMTRVESAGSTRYLTDHGFNATPYWIALNRLFVHQTKANENSVRLLTVIDFTLLMSMFAMIWWAFGLETAALTALLWGTSRIWIYLHVGAMGSFGRMYFIWAAVASVCLLKKQQHWFGGAMLAAAALFRVFPGAMFFGPAIIMVSQLLRGNWPDRRLVGLALGAVLTMALATGPTFQSLGGFGTFNNFLENSLKHAGTPLSNYMGLKTILSFSPQELDAQAWRRASPEDDPISAWKTMRRETFEQRKVIFYVSVVLLLGFYGVACHAMREPWKLVATGAFPVFCLFELTNYYFVLMILLAPFAKGRLLHIVVLIGMSFAGPTLLRHTKEVLTFPIFSAIILLVMLYFLCAEVYEYRRNRE